RSTRTVTLDNRRLLKGTKTRKIPASPSRKALEISTSCKQSIFGSPHQDKPFRGFIEKPRWATGTSRREATRRQQEPLLKTLAPNFYPETLGNLKSFLTQVVEVLSNPKEYAINQWVDRQGGLDRLPRDQDKMVRRLQAGEKRQELHACIINCVMSSFVLGTSLLLLKAITAVNT
ncbi:hypothetical protein CORC01_08254, partial [Colletotrichum orchidophilum]